MGLAPVFCCRTGRTVVCRREQEGEEAVCRGLPQSLRFFGDSDGSDQVLPPTTWNVVTFPEEKESVRRTEGDFVWVTLEVTLLLGATGSRYGEEEGTKKVLDRGSAFVAFSMAGSSASEVIFLSVSHSITLMGEFNK